jgi:hypothetical protein
VIGTDDADKFRSEATYRFTRLAEAGAEERTSRRLVLAAHDRRV